MTTEISSRHIEALGAAVAKGKPWYDGGFILEPRSYRHTRSMGGAVRRMALRLEESGLIDGHWHITAAGLRALITYYGGRGSIGLPKVPMAEHPNPRAATLELLQARLVDQEAKEARDAAAQAERDQEEAEQARVANAERRKAWLFRLRIVLNEEGLASAADRDDEQLIALVRRIEGAEYERA